MFITVVSDVNRNNAENNPVYKFIQSYGMVLMEVVWEIIWSRKWK
jgi:hypothetical protein